MDKIFMIAAPGSRWSGIAQNIEDNIPGFNISDRNTSRTYSHHNFSGHKGVYFGTGWENGIELDEQNFNKGYSNLNGIRILKSHEWAYHLDEIKNKFPDSWIFLVYRPDLSCYSWWHEAGGFSIKYPDYIPYYKNSMNMLNEIIKQNNSILEFSQKNNLTWSHISGSWIEDNFGKYVEPTVQLPDTLVTLLKR